MIPLSRPRSLRRLADDVSGQLITEWVLVTTVVVLPLAVLAPSMIKMIRIYFYRVAEVITLPFP